MSEADVVLQLTELLRVAITPPAQPRERLWIATAFGLGGVLAGLGLYAALRSGGFIK